MGNETCCFKSAVSRIDWNEEDEGEEGLST